MTTLDKHSSTSFAKIIYIGDSGTGKTGSLTSLVKAGYKLRILDYDNGLDALRQFVAHECPDRASAVDFITLRDKRVMTGGGPVVTAPKAYVAGTKFLDKWEDGTVPSEWGDDTIFVLDSSTSFGRAAFEWARGMNPGAKDPRQWYFAAQQSFEQIIALLTSDEFHANVIVIAHISYMELEEGFTKGFPTSIGSAFGPKMLTYFNTLISAEKQGQGEKVKRIIKTVPTALLDLKNPAPFAMSPTYDLGTGMAEIFKTLKGSNTQTPNSLKAAAAATG